MQHAPGTQHPRRRRRLDWELIACGWSGHVLIDARAAPAHVAGATVVRPGAGVDWFRCLRCDAWLALGGESSARAGIVGDGAALTLPLRGRALRDRVVLRLIAVDRVVHVVVLGLLGIGVLAFTAHREAVHDTYYRVLTALQGGVAGGPVSTTGHVGILRDFDRLFTLSSGTLTEVGVALLAYAALEAVEAVGLWRGRRWAEYLTFLATVVLLPLEIYEIVERASVLKIIGFIINLAVVVYLLARKRLFGLRGGGRAEQARREADMGWPAIARSTPPAAEGA